MKVPKVRSGYLKQEFHCYKCPNDYPLVDYLNGEMFCKNDEGQWYDSESMDHERFFYKIPKDKDQK